MGNVIWRDALPRLEARLRSGKEVSLSFRTSAPQRMKDGEGEGNREGEEEQQGVRKRTKRRGKKRKKMVDLGMYFPKWSGLASTSQSV